MKSIMQEASSLMKAIEQAWTTAGKPQEFTVKILEEAQKNFIGLTTRSAKIALFFGEKQTAKIHEPKQRQPRYQHAKEVREEREPREQREPREYREKRHTEQQENQPAQRAEQPRQQRMQQPLWTEEMVDFSKNWMSENLAIMHKHISFTIEPQNFHLRITLSSPILDQHDKEKHLLASFSLLLIETLKKNFRSALRGHKIVLTHA